MLVCMLCYVKCPCWCWMKIKNKDCMRALAEQPFVHEGYPHPLCTCRTSNMERHARTVHGLSKQEFLVTVQEQEKERRFELFLRWQAALAARYREENRRMLLGRKVDEDDGWVFVEHCKEEPSAFLLARALSTGE